MSGFEDDTPAPTVAKCERCGREFITLPREGERDTYKPQNKWWDATKEEREAMGECGGLIVALPAAKGPA